MAGSREAAIVDAVRDAVAAAGGSIFRPVVGLVDLLSAPRRTVMIASERLEHDDSGAGLRRWTLRMLIGLVTAAGSDSGDAHAESGQLDEVRALLDGLDGAEQLKPAVLGVERLVRGGVEYWGPPLGQPGGPRGAFFDLTVQWKA